MSNHVKTVLGPAGCFNLSWAVYFIHVCTEVEIKKTHIRSSTGSLQRSTRGGARERQRQEVPIARLKVEHLLLCPSVGRCRRGGNQGGHGFFVVWGGGLGFGELFPAPLSVTVWVGGLTRSATF